MWWSTTTLGWSDPSSGWARYPSICSPPCPASVIVCATMPSVTPSALRISAPPARACLGVRFSGPAEVWVVARVDVDDGLTGAEVEGLVAGIERDLTSREETITRVDVVPVGQAPPATG